jgi:hypothetical protein
VHDFYQRHHTARLKDTSASPAEVRIRQQAACLYLKGSSQLPGQSAVFDAAAGDARLAHLTETASVVHQLLAPLNRLRQGHGEPGARGKLVVVRVDNNKQGICFTAGLSRAMKLADTQAGMHTAAIIPDFGEFTVKTMPVDARRRLQPGRACTHELCDCREWHAAAATGTSACSTCKHEHVQATQYEDLLHLPCIVLLNERGRMGDTFPHSFVCMDLRLRYQNDDGFLRSVTQELGRMCRYVCPRIHTADNGDQSMLCTTCDAPYEDDWAYALVGRKLAKWLDKNVTLDPEQVSAVRGLPLSDKLRTITASGKRRIRELQQAQAESGKVQLLQPPRTYHRFEANEKSYDHSRTAASLRHLRRIVLHVECQIGKTGSYLATVALLKQIIEAGRDGRAEEEEVVAQLRIPLADGEQWNEDEHPHEALLGGKFPSYNNLRVGKYHARVLLARLTLLRSLIPKGSDWCVGFINTVRAGFARAARVSRRPAAPDCAVLQRRTQAVTSSCERHGAGSVLFAGCASCAQLRWAHEAHPPSH